MKKTLEDNNYIVIRNFISKDRALNLFLEYANYCKNNDVRGDSQSPNSFAIRDCIPFLELLCEKTPEISHVIEETVLPTYSYARLYKNGSILKKHTDRDACEISLTLHLHGDQSWPIWIETPSGEEVSVNLESGDAMLYLGRKSPHWRDEYGGQYYTQVFLHYVRSRGDCCHEYFDKLNPYTILQNERKYEGMNMV